MLYNASYMQCSVMVYSKLSKMNGALVMFAFVFQWNVTKVWIQLDAFKYGRLVKTHIWKQDRATISAACILVEWSGQPNWARPKRLGLPFQYLMDSLLPDTFYLVYVCVELFGWGLVQSQQQWQNCRFVFTHNVGWWLARRSVLSSFQSCIAHQTHAI